MKESRFKIILGFAVVAMHICWFSVLTLLFFNDGFLREEFTTLLAIVAPVMGIYVSAVVKAFTKSSASRKMLPLSQVTLTLIFTVIYFSVLFSAIVGKAYNWSPNLDFETLKAILAISEFSFGMYFSLLFFKLFG